MLTGVSLIKEDEVKPILFFILFLTLIMSSLFLLFLNNRRIDREYRDILFLNRESIHATETLLLQSSNTQRALLNLIITNDSADIKVMNDRISNSSDKNDSALAVIESSFLTLNDDAKSTFNSMKKASENYRTSYLKFIDLLNIGELNSINDFRIKELRPSLDKYQSSQQVFLVSMTNDIIERSNQTSSRFSRNSWLLLALGVSPYLIFIFGMFYTINKKQAYPTN